MPIPPPTTGMTATGLRTLGKGSPKILLIGLLASLAAARLAQDSYNGSREKRNINVAHMKEHAEWKDMEFGWGHWSGHPWMDKLAHRANKKLHFGFWNLKIKWQEFKIRASSLFNDVILKNFLPLGLAAGFLYTGMGHANIRKALGKAGSAMAGSSILKQVGTHLGKLGLVGLTLGGRAIKGLLDLATRSTTNFAISLGAILLGVFFSNRFNDSMTHDGQHDFFRDFTNAKH